MRVSAEEIWAGGAGGCMASAGGETKPGSSEPSPGPRIEAWPAREKEAARRKANRAGDFILGAGP
jgi:hypothetical protein